MGHMPLGARQTMWTLGLGDLATRQVEGVRVSVVLTDQYGQGAGQISAQSSFTEANAADSGRVVQAHVGQHVNAAVGSDRSFDQRSLTERHISQDELSTCRQAEQAESRLLGSDGGSKVRKQAIHNAEGPLFTCSYGVIWRRRSDTAEVIGMNIGELLQIELRNEDELPVTLSSRGHDVAKRRRSAINTVQRNSNRGAPYLG